MTPRPARYLLVLCAVAAVLCGVLAPPAAADDDASAVDHVVLVGVSGLMWSDVTASGTPNLAALTGRGASAALSVRTVESTTCPTDGWLTVGAGARATGGRSGGACPPVPEPVVAPDGALTVPDLPRVADRNDKYAYDPAFGAAAAAVAGTGGCVTAVGPGAAVATADKDGRSPAGYLPDAAALDQASLARCPLTVVDLGSTDRPETGRVPGDALRAFDTELGRLVAELPPRTRLVVAGVADGGDAAHLRVLTVSGDGFGSGLLTTSSTRRDGMAQLTDIAPSLLAPLGIGAPSAMVGAEVRRTGGPSGADAVHDLRLLDVGAQAAREVRETYQFLTWLTLVPLLVFAAGIGWSGRLRRTGASDAARRRVFRVLRVVAVAAASVPAATFLVGLFPWTEASSPEAAIIGLSLGGAALLTVAALAGPWRRHPYGPPGFVAAATAVILAGDAVTGSHLQMNTVFGLSPLIAGRFYGFGNVAWSLFGMVVLFAAAWLVGPMLDDSRRRGGGSRRPAVLVLVACGLAAVVVDGWPAFGSDFGGVLALVPGFAVLGLLLTGTRVSWVKAGAVAAGAVAAVTVIAVLDWTRPAGSRSHLGRFVQQVIDGEAGSVLRRKISDNLSSFDGPVGFLIPVLMVLALTAILAPPKLRATVLPTAYERVTWLRPVLIACWVTAVVGYAANDSGIQIPTVALLIAVPLVAAVLAEVAAESAAGSGSDAGAAPRPQAEPHGAE
ncbi:hypothetical protein LO772_17520 [Yinghuangia sp. ASG 101]|uniref:hypothetical protein n=1 Tax=Yinghuangia sp. ASG 101 TaxID=2896848 RepID=UPI001E4D2D03|nr:hypothetical protein [Yinghuangia sp. ASG 101]UGQ15200.1 hypothetical protein LO772_17520 [Yinghuangia sp. ASG 101]